MADFRATYRLQLTAEFGFREALEMTTTAAVPLTTGPRAIGILEAVNSRRGLFRSEDVRLLSLLGAQVGSVIEAIRARDRERALMSELREVDRTRSEFISMLAHELRHFVNFRVSTTGDYV